MSSNFLLLNLNKTEMLVNIDISQVTSRDSRQLCDIPKLDSQEVRCTLDLTLSFDQHIKDINKIAFFTYATQHFLSMADAEILVHAFVSSRLD